MGIRAAFAGILILFPLIKCMQLQIISRDKWEARDARKIDVLQEYPVPFVVIHHSATRGCSDAYECEKLVKSFQTYHMDTQQWDDIGYNFLISDDGTIYEGRGWEVAGTHAPKYNRRSIGICFIAKIPTQEALASAQDLINEGIANGHIDSQYKLIGHRQTVSTECPGKALFDLIKEWPNWSSVKQT